MDDSQLLRRYVEERSEDAFAALVQKHVNLVYYAALRQTDGIAALAEDVTQAVFTDLARKAASLTDRSVLTGWLYTSTRFTAAKARRTERRRRAREQEAFAMQEILRMEDAPLDWDQLRPAIDDALHTLDAIDREAVLLRFFEGQAFTEIGRALQLTEDATRKRVERALDKMAGVLARHGVTSTSAALAAAMASQAGVAAPAGLATTVTSAALVGATAAVTGTSAALSFFGLMTTTNPMIGIAGAVAALATGALLYEANAAKKSWATLMTSTQQESALVANLPELDRRFGEAMRRVQLAEEEHARLLKALQAASVSSAPPAAAMAAVVTQNSGANQSFFDPQYGVKAQLPNGWAIRSSNRWGNKETTVFFQPPTPSQAVPSVYYRVFDEPMTLSAPEIDAWLRNLAEKKAAQRVREGASDYANSAELTSLTVGGRPALAWMATYTGGGQVISEYFTRIYSPNASVLYFFKAPANEMASLRPAFEEMIQTTAVP